MRRQSSDGTARQSQKSSCTSSDCSEDEAGTGTEQHRQKEANEEELKDDDTREQSRVGQGQGENEQRRERRLKMNRESARNRRKRQRELIQELQDETTRLKRENQEIRQENEDLRAQVMQFQSALYFLNASAPATAIDATTIFPQLGLSRPGVLGSMSRQREEMAQRVLQLELQRRQMIPFDVSSRQHAHMMATASGIGAQVASRFDAARLLEDHRLQSSAGESAPIPHLLDSSLGALQEGSRNAFLDGLLRRDALLQQAPILSLNPATGHSVSERPRTDQYIDERQRLTATHPVPPVASLPRDERDRVRLLDVATGINRFAYSDVLNNVCLFMLDLIK